MIKQELFQLHSHLQRLDQIISASGTTKTCRAKFLLPNENYQDFCKIESSINQWGYASLSELNSLVCAPGLKECFVLHLVWFLFFFLSQTSIKWSQPDEDNKCLGEVHLTIDPKYRGMSTGSWHRTRLSLVI